MKIKKELFFWIDDKVHCITDVVSANEITFNKALNFAKEKGLEIPTQKELMALFINKEKVNKKLINKIKESWLWSSTESNGNVAWILRPSDGLMSGNDKYYTSTARCSFAFNHSSI